MDFTIFFFALELLVLLAAFRRKFLLHLGYMLDLAIVAACLWRELQGGSKELRLLGYCRGWRVVRLVNTLVEQAQERASRAADREAEAQRRAIEVEADRRRLAEALRLEREARKNTETMLLGYKEEAETLREALNIAAMDIAEAAASDLEGDGSDGSASDESSPMHEDKRRGTASKADRLGDDRGDRIFVSEDGSWTSR
ncbi:hypothetical protein JKP88DRAFT_222987 [Tribonema minus]|uniref:Voltage-gated hydrogen channel 1 n=1 Tax=Tribonema minus TaxID=303371 RepID=A0A835YTE1_9STRA|nr:hypothetical protein JKP88DRAFT_222987 [Tribonema minus]